MNIAQNIRAGVIEDLIATLQAQKVLVEVQLDILQLGAHGAIADENATAHGREEWVISGNLGQSVSSH